MVAAFFDVIDATTEQLVRLDPARPVRVGGQVVVTLRGPFTTDDAGTRRFVRAVPGLQPFLDEIEGLTGPLPLLVAGSPDLGVLRQAAGNASTESLLALEWFIGEPSRDVALQLFQRPPQPYSLLVHALAALNRLNGRRVSVGEWAVLTLQEAAGIWWSGQVIWPEIERRLMERPAGHALLAAIWGDDGPLRQLAGRIGDALPETAGGRGNTREAIKEKIAAGVADLWKVGQSVASKRGDWLEPAVLGEMEVVMTALKCDVVDRWRQRGRTALAHAEERKLPDGLPSAAGRVAPEQERVLERRALLEILARSDMPPQVRRIVDIYRDQPEIDTLSDLADRLGVSKQHLNALLKQPRRVYAAHAQ